MSSAVPNRPNSLLDLILHCRQKKTDLHNSDSKSDCTAVLKKMLQCNEGIAGFLYQSFLNEHQNTNESDLHSIRDNLKKDLLGVLEHLKQIHRSDPAFSRPKEFIVQKMYVIQQGVTFFADNIFKILRLKLFLMMECCLSFVRSASFLNMAGEKPGDEVKHQIDRLVRQNIFKADAITMATFWYQAQKFNQQVLESAGVAFDDSVEREE